MALHLVLSRLCDKPPLPRAVLNLSRISYSSESEEWSTIDLHPQFLKDANSTTCSGDGLLGFCSYLGVYVIWNQSSDKYEWIHRNDSANIPCACGGCGGCERGVDHVAHGLGFIPESHDFKLVRFMNCYYMDYYNDEDDEEVFHSSSSYNVAVYSSKTGSWKELPFPFHFEDISPKHGEASTCVKGFIYWITSMNVILSFDLSSDKFSTLPCPDDIPRHSKKAHLLEFDGSLCLVIQFQSKKKATRPTTKIFRFWVYTASSISSSSSPWTRKRNLDIRLSAGVAKRPLWLGKKNNGGEFLMLQGSDGSVLEYDYTSRELKRIDLIIPPHVPKYVKDKMIISPYVVTNANIANNKRGNGDIVDRISQLPDYMILCILYFLSLKEAASTTVLSTRWSDLWRHTSNLNFNYVNVKMNDMPEYMNWVNSVVESHKASSLKEFNITFSNYESSSSTFIKLLEFALPRRVEVLELNFFGRRFDFLRTILKSTNLISLCLKCLRVSGNDIGLLLRNCPLLERLIIKFAALTSDLEVCGSALKHLDIQYCEGGKSVKGVDT